MNATKESAYPRGNGVVRRHKSPTQEPEPLVTQEIQMQARHIVTAFAVMAVATVAVAPASAAKSKPFKGSKEVTDVTADPTGSATDGPDCSSLVPSAVSAWQDTPVSVKIPAIGKLKVEVVNTGDWALEVRDPKGSIVGYGDSSDPAAHEMTTVKTKKTGTYKIWACNLGGAPTATLKWSWTPA